MILSSIRGLTSPMNETPLLEPSRPTAAHRWVMPLVVVLTGAAIGGALYYMLGAQHEINTQMASRLQEMQSAQTSAGKLSPEEAQAMQALPLQLEELAKATKATNEQLTALTTRLEALETATRKLTETAPKTPLTSAANASDLRQFLALK
ncbi:MAG: hypothetical protein B7X02_00700 [Rhodospirillales bacterium 12-54-5]|nr:MAG: hypothetical protein B7X02_00700 [Rhodospirillales bacterium 12-54-5]